MILGGNFWTLFTPGIWKLLHAVLHLGDWSQSAIRIIGPYLPIAETVIDQIDLFLAVHSSTMNGSGVRGDSPFSGALCRAVDLLKYPKPAAA